MGQHAPVLYDTLSVPFQLLRLILGIHAGCGRHSADLHLDLGQSILQIPLLLRELCVQCLILRFHRMQSFPQPLDLVLENLVGAQKGRGSTTSTAHTRPIALQLRTGVANVTYIWGLYYII